MGQRVTEILPGRIITKRNSVKGLLPRRESQLVPIVEFALNLRNMMEKRRWPRSWPSSDLKNYHKTKFGKRSVTEKRVTTGTDRGIRIKLEKYDGKTAVAAFLAKF